MSECISYTKPYPEDDECPATGFQRIGVCVPVTVMPFAQTGDTVTRCCGDAKVVSMNTNCPGKKNGACTFTISQTICVEVPVKFGANAVVGDIFVDCMGASADDICANCRSEENIY